MFRRVRAFYNPWFILPFLVWMLAGSVLLMVFDRSQLFRTVNLHHTVFLDYVLYLATFLGDGVGIAVVLALIMVLFRSCRNGWFVVAAIVCIVAPALLIQAVKSFVDAPRPLEFYKQDILKNAEWVHIREHWPHLFHRSFPSGHSGGVFSLCCFLSMILPRGWSRAGLLLFFIALLVAYSRMYLAAHFYLDIFVGSLLGTVTTLFCFALMRRWSNRSFRIVRRGGHSEKPLP